LWVWANIAWTDVGVIRGPAGVGGYFGSTGYTGSKGIDGFAGSSGYDGSRGIDGFAGSSGYWGSAGYDGSRGIDGFAGSSGYDGSKGADGYFGSTGYDGSIGSTGYTGSQGNTGTVGYTGSTGIVTAGTGLVYTTSTGEIYLDSSIVTTTGTQTLTNKTIIVPSGGALYFEDDVALAAAHAINVPFKQVSAAPRVYTQSIDFVNGAWWSFMGTSADTGLTVADVQSSGSGAPSLNYTGPAYDMYYDIDTDNAYIWMPMASTDLKPGDYYYDDINQVLSICYAYVDPVTNAITYGLRPFV
jgi:hypothetical protein